MDLLKLEFLERLVNIKVSLTSINFISATLDDLIREVVVDLGRKPYVGDGESLPTTSLRPMFPENSLVSCNKL